MNAIVRMTLHAAIAATLAALSSLSFAAPDEAVMRSVQREKEPLLSTMKDLVAIESGSGDREGLDAISSLIHGRLAALGGSVEYVEPPADSYRMHDTPARIGRMVLARFNGRGKAKILMIAHMDTVYLRGMGAKQPFRIDGNRAYGLGIADDKQGVALILHTLKVLKDVGFDQYGTITVLINADEEVSSPGSRSLLTKLGAEHDAVMSFEGSRHNSDHLSLATSGIAAVTLHVKGKASHAGSAPELGRNALYELAHQILQTKDFSDPATGLKMNWTIAKAGTNRNVIAADAEAAADVRVLRIADYDGIEAKVRDKIRNKLIPDTVVEMVFERRRPPLEVTDANRALAKHAQTIYREIGKELKVMEGAEGGGTDAAFASLQTKASVVERFGLAGFGAHSNDAEYVLIDSIEPRMYLAARLIQDVGRGSVR